MTRAILLMLMLTGCASFNERGYAPYGGAPYGVTPYGVPAAEVVVRQPDFYTRNEIDALNARTECRWLAKNMVQMARCDGR